MDESTKPDFTGKVLTLNVDGTDNRFTLVSPHFEYQAGRLFLVGNVPTGRSPKGWTEGALTALAWEKVNAYLLFDSLEDYTARVEHFQNKAKA